MPQSWQDIYDIRNRMGNAKFYNYLESVCLNFHHMRAGDRFIVTQSVKQCNWPLFMACVFIYITEFGDIAFNKDCSQIIKFQKI